MKHLFGILLFFCFSFCFLNIQVGVGTTNPQSSLDVKGNISIGNNYSGMPGVTAPVNGAIIEGNVGIGLTNPITNLVVQSNNSNDVVRIENTGVGSTYQYLGIEPNFNNGPYNKIWCRI